MGEVYTARDPRLNRLIAIKLLPVGAANDPERRQRFEREAQAVAALNHPNIVTIHSVEEAGGQSFLTMELVDGRPLADVLPRSGFPLPELLPIAIPLADAIASAHQQGITHRDLKPANVMIGQGVRRGRVKVLDFGLAKLADSPLAAGGATAMPTGPITGEGRILGTVAYMSPEQAEGKAIDARSDLFSFGVMLYEMATGRRPFTGETSISIISSIIKDTPKPVVEVNARVPRELGRIIHRALMKDPERRYQNAKDLRNDLEELKASLDSGELLAAPPLPAGRSSRGVVIAGVAAFVVLAAGWYVWTHRGAASSGASGAAVASAPARDLQITQLTTSGNAERPAISPDGKYVAYVQRDGTDESLWIRQTATSSTVRVVAAEPGSRLFGATFTLDGSFVDFVRQTGGGTFDIWRVPFLGGTPKLLIRDVTSPIGWSPDARQIAYVRRAPQPRQSLLVADPDGGHERELAMWRPPQFLAVLSAPWRPTVAPSWSADGRFVAVGGVDRSEGSLKAVVHVIDASTGSTRTIPCACGLIFGLAWLDGRSLVVDGTGAGPAQLMRLLNPGGTLSRLTNDPNEYQGVSLTADRRTLVTARQESLMNIWIGDAAATSGTDALQRVSPSNIGSLAWWGDRLLYNSSINGRASVLAYTPGGSSEELSPDAISQAGSSDGSTLALVAPEAGGPVGLWTADRNGRRGNRIATSLTSMPPRLTPDGQSVIFAAVSEGRQFLGMIPITGGTVTHILDAGVASVDVSRDGRSIVFDLAGEDGKTSTVICDLPACSSRRTIPYVASESPRYWTLDGRGIAYASQGNIWVQALDGKQPRQLTRFTDGREIRAFAWSHDGKRLAIGRVSVTNDIVLIAGLQDSQH